MAGTPHPHPFVEGAGGVVFNDHGQVLLIRQKDGSWVFPKGHLDPGEDHLRAAVREVEEEAGVRAHCPEPERHWTTSYINPRGEHRRITWFRLVTADTRPIMREKRFPEGCFAAPDIALELLSFGEDRSLLEGVLAHVSPS